MKSFPARLLPGCLAATLSLVACSGALAHDAANLNDTGVERMNDSIATKMLEVQVLLSEYFQRRRKPAAWPDQDLTRLESDLQHMKEDADMSLEYFLAKGVNIQSPEVLKGYPIAGRAVAASVMPGIAARGDPGLLAQVIANLVGNAWKFTARRADAHIEVGMTLQDERRVFFVRDNGAGFDSSGAAKVFDAFQRLHSAQEFPGTGIGLATVQRIIRNHGGDIWAEGQSGEGATFYFTSSQGVAA